MELTDIPFPSYEALCAKYPHRNIDPSRYPGMVRYYNELVPEHQEEIELFRSHDMLSPEQTPEAYHKYLVYFIVITQT
jgi:hypothetical protein